MNLADILRGSFALAHQRAGLILLDIVWKAVWGVLAVATLFLAILWFSSGLQAIEWEDTGLSALNGLIATALLQEFWNAKRIELIATIFAALSLAGALWVFLEAFFRRMIVSAVCGRPKSTDLSIGLRTPAYPFNVFLASSVSKNIVLCAGVALVAALAWLGAATVGIVTLCAAIFLLTLFDTLIRADAVDLMGTDLIRVAGLLGILMSFESMVAASFVTILFAAFLNTAGQAEALVVLMAAAVAAVLLTLLHSYLLLVRFSAITIMRRDVVEV